MYGVRDNFNRTKSYNAPELTQAMKAKRNAIAVVLAVAGVVSVSLYMLITLTPVAIWGPVLVFLGVVGLFLFMFIIGFELVGAGMDWIGEQFTTWKNAKEYGVRDE